MSLQRRIGRRNAEPNNSIVYRDERFGALCV